MAGQQPKKVVGGAFGQFLAKQRPALVLELQGQPVSAVSKLAGERWKALGQAEKDIYEKAYKEAKAKYDSDMEAFLAGGGVAIPRKRKADKEGKKKNKDLNKPKKPAGGAYGCFVASNRAEFAKQCVGKPAVEVTKIAAAKWKTLSDAEKQPFEKEYQKKLEEYKTAMAAYTPPAGDEEDEEGEGEEGEDEDEDEKENDIEPVRKKPARA